MKVLQYQLWHFLFLILLLFGVYFMVNQDSSILDGTYWGLHTKTCLIIAILTPILHQIYVLICWRLELYYKSVSKLFGNNGFKIYKVGFALLFVSRLLTIIFLAIANAHSLEIKALIAYIIAAVLFVPAIYLFYSVKKYFGIDRAFGIDHFDPEALKNVPFVKKGIFKYSANSMYVFGFFILWIPGFLFLSKAALIAALFNHLYIWVHYYFTELPDMKVIYGAKAST